MTPGRIVMRGSARREVDPDVADLRLAVKEVDADRREAFVRCSERVGSIVTRLEAAVGSDGDVTAGRVSLDRHYEPSKENGAPQRYAASCALGARCAPPRAPEVIAAAVEAGIDELTGPRYSLRDPTLREAGTDSGWTMDADGFDKFEPRGIRVAGGQLQPAQISVGVMVSVAFAFDDPRADALPSSTA